MGKLRAESLVRDVPDFPKAGIVFKDIMPVLQDPAAFREAVDALTERARRLNPDIIVGIEARGFLLGAPVALALGIPFAALRKPGKLPWKCLSEEYTLEYGSNTVEMHIDSVHPGQRAVIVDDLLATGGTASASVRLVERLNGKVAGACFLIELGFLDGRKALSGYEVECLIRYD